MTNAIPALPPAGIAALGLFVLAGCTVDRNTGASPEANAPAVTAKGNPDLIRVSMPAPGTVIRSPLTVTGEARGPWYFEGDFPIEIQDENGMRIAQGIGRAQGEWMTTDFVPFEAMVLFDAPASQAGRIVFQKDNPSGLIEHDDSFTIPILFR